MTLQEAYKLAEEKYPGESIYVTASILSSDNGPFENYSIHIGEISSVAERSFEDCFKDLDKVDFSKVKSEKISKLKEELEELES